MNENQMPLEQSEDLRKKPFSWRLLLVCFLVLVIVFAGSFYYFRNLPPIEVDNSIPDTSCLVDDDCKLIQSIDKRYDATLQYATLGCFNKDYKDPNWKILEENKKVCTCKTNVCVISGDVLDSGADDGVDTSNWKTYVVPEPFGGYEISFPRTYGCQEADRAICEDTSDRVTAESGELSIYNRSFYEESDSELVSFGFSIKKSTKPADVGFEVHIVSEAQSESATENLETIIHDQTTLNGYNMIKVEVLNSEPLSDIYFVEKNDTSYVRIILNKYKPEQIDENEILAVLSTFKLSQEEVKYFVLGSDCVTDEDCGKCEPIPNSCGLGWLPGCVEGKCEAVETTP